MQYPYGICSATAQMLVTCGFVALDKNLGAYRDLCQEKWVAYYAMSNAIVSSHTHEVPTTCGRKALITDSAPAMWSAVQQWRELHERTSSWHSTCIMNDVYSVSDGRYDFIDLWARHLVLWAIHNGGTASQSLMNITYNEYKLSQIGEHLPDLED